jgi:integrase
LEEWEIAKLMMASPPEDGDFWSFILGTGLRAGELAALEWSDIDWTQRQILVRAEVSKSRRERWIPLRADLLPVLQRQARQKPGRKAKAAARVAGAEATLARAGDDAERATAAKRLDKARRTEKEAERLVFGNSAGGQWDGHLSRRLKPCLKAAGLPEEIDLHTLRHTFASHMVRAGVDLKTVGDLLGHSSVAITAIYIHPFEERKAQAVELVPIPGGIEDRQTAGKPPVEAASG